LEKWKGNLLAMWFVQFFSILGFGFARPFLPFYLEELGMTDPARIRIWSGLFQAAAPITMIIVTPFWGYLADRIGRKPMSLRAAMGGSLAMLALGLASSPEMLITVRLIQGLFTGTVTANLTLAVTASPPKKTGLAVGVMNSAVFAGSSFAPLIGGLLADSLSYRSAFFAASVVLAGAFVLVLLTVQEDFRRVPGKPFSFFGDAKALLMRPGVLVMVALVIPLYAFSRMIPLPMLPLVVQEVSASTYRIATRTGLVSTGAGIATVLAGLLIGVLADRIRLGRFAAVFCAAGAVCTIPLFFVARLWHLAAFVFLAAFFVGGLDPIVKVMTMRRVPESSRGAALGLMGSSRAVGWSSGAVAGGVAAAALGLRSIYLISGFLLLVLVPVLFIVFSRKAAEVSSPEVLG
jgi:DHA1 family multidrug resistance protein-like MFS transporter